MTTITQDVNDIAGVDDDTSWTFYTEQIRESGDGTAIISTKKVRKYPVAGVLTVELDPGPAVVLAADGKTYSFTVPDADTTLWPLIQAAVTIPPGTKHQELLDAVDAWLASHTDVWASIPDKPAFIAAGATAADARAAIGIDLTDLDEWEWYANLAAFPGTGVTDVVYGARDTEKFYRWSGSAYVQLSGGISVVTYSGSLSTARPTADAVYWVGYPSTPTNAQSQDIVASTVTVVADTSFTLQDASDATKQVQFDVASGQTTGTTRVFTLPAVSGTFATKDGTETLTSKTLNGCTINTPTGLAKTDVGLGSVDNTSDATKNSASATLTNKTLTNPTITGYTESTVAIGTVTSSSTISLTSGTVQTATLTASTACTFTMPTAVAGKSFTLLLKQAVTTGNGSATFTGVKWSAGTAPTITATAAKMDILTFVSDGTNWYGSITQNFTP